MRSSPSPCIRTALLAMCSVSLAASLASFCLAFTVPSPSRNLRPIIANIDLMYSPVYVSMISAGLLILAASVAMASSRHGNRAFDLAGCVTLLAAIILALTSLGLAAAIKKNESSMEATLSASLKLYGPGNVSVYVAWDQMQTELVCCAVRTNQAQDAYRQTPWYELMRQGNPYSAPKVPNSCCSQRIAGNPTQLADCTTNLPTLPAQNQNLNPVGCFEGVQSMLDAFTSRYIIVSVILLISSGATLGISAHHLLLLTRGAAASSLEGKRSLASGKSLGGVVGNGFDNPAASGSTVGLSRASLVSGSLASSTAGRPGRSPAQSVYSAATPAATRQSADSRGSQRSSASRGEASSKAAGPIPASLKSAGPIPASSKASGTFPASSKAAGPIPASSKASGTFPASSKASAPSLSPSSAAGLSPASSKAAGPGPAVEPKSAAPAPTVLKAQPIRGRQPGTAHRGAAAASANQQNRAAAAAAASSQVGANHRATSLPPAANHRAASPQAAANQNHKSATAQETNGVKTQPHHYQTQQQQQQRQQQQTTVLTPNGKHESNF